MAGRGGGGWRGSGGRAGDHRGRGTGGRRGGAGGYHYQQPPYGRDVGPGRRGQYPYQQPLGRGRGEGGDQRRGGVEPRVRPSDPVVPAAASTSSSAPAPAPSSTWAPPAPPAPAAAASASAPALASSSAWARGPPSLATAVSASAPASASSSATVTGLARGVGSLAVGDTAPPAPAATSAAPAPALRPEAPPLSSKGIAPPARPGSGTLGRKIFVRANHFLVKVADSDICHYAVSVSPEPKARRINRVLLSEIVKVHGVTDLADKKLAYDGSKSLYTAGELPFKTKEFAVKLGKEHREIEYTVMIRYASRANLNHLQQFLNGQQRESSQATIQALDVVLRESPSLKYVTVSRSFFSKEFDGEKDIGGGLECWRGYYQSLRPTRMGLSLNIDACSTAFYKSISVVEFVDKCLGVTNPAQPFSDSDRLKIKKALRGVRVETTHQQGKTSIYKITGITSIPLEDLKFIRNEGHQITVVQYFDQQYSCLLRYTTWPCLQSGSDSKPIYLPMEVCKIIAGQKYPRKLTDAQVVSILRKTCESPQKREERIMKMVKQNNYSADALANSFQITVANQMANVQARVLRPPMLKYHESGTERTVVPNGGQWDMTGKKMVKGGKVRSWTCINFSLLQSGLVDSILEGLVQACNSIGMDFSGYPVTKVMSASTDCIEDALRDVHNSTNLELLVVIIPKDKGHYGKIKRLCETELGIVSQCINPGPKKTRQYFTNIALKINVKVGGCNTVLEEAFMRNGIPFLSDIPTIIFGADVTHPVAGDDSSASIAAVVASMDWPEVTTYKALISAQAHRQEIIQDLFETHTDPEKGTQVYGGMIRELLLSFYKRNNKKPSRIIFYRDGVSEGQFSHVLLHEMDQIRKACASLQADYRPKVTFVVVQKRHHTRLFPFPDTSGNVLPGTVVDNDICHPSEFDFYLCSHAGIQGTSRPAHYHVLYDDNDFSADAMQSLTNNLCYTYARCTRAVSVVPPVYYAHLAAFRARCYDEQAGNDGGPPAGLRRLPQVKDNVKEVMFFC